MKKSTIEPTLASNGYMHIHIPLNELPQSNYGSKPERVQKASIKQGGVSAKNITFKPTLHTDDGEESLNEGMNQSNIQLS